MKRASAAPRTADGQERRSDPAEARPDFFAQASPVARGDRTASAGLTVAARACAPRRAGAVPPTPPSSPARRRASRSR
jgi:hypothetical protein